MPAMGPSYSESHANKAVEEIKKLLADKYDVFRHPVDNRSLADWNETRAEAHEKLKEAIHLMFKYESYESF